MINYFKTYDSSVNQSGKVHLRNSTQNRVTGEVKKQLENERQPENERQAENVKILDWTLAILAC